MLAVDTNVVVRFLMRDDPAQSERARALFESNEIFVPKTVLVETEWVLRRSFRLSREAIFDGLTRLTGMANVACEDQAAVVEALQWGRTGMDFADALHLASSRDAEGFATFDRDLVRAARRARTIPVVQPGSLSAASLPPLRTSAASNARSRRPPRGGR